MSRLIDADVLKAIYDPSSYEGHDPNENWDNVISTFEEIRTDIDDQPTVDAVPVKHGHWIRGKSYPHNIYCSRCYRTYVPNDEIEMWKDDTRLPRKYCPECGAKMDEVTE